MKVAFLWELLNIGFHVLISDLDVVWLNDHWQRWMSHAEASRPAVPEARMIAFADVLVTTDELSTDRDAQGGKLGGMHTELNTGVVYFRCTKGSLAMVQTWRKAMMSQKGRKDLNENVNDQSLFNQVVRGAQLSGSSLTNWKDGLSKNGLLQLAPTAFDNLPSNARVVHMTHAAHEPCLESRSCEKVHFTFGTLPMRPFTGGHTWFNQNVQEMPGYELPQNEPITVHFTFQFGDTGDYPHGKRQRAREAALWAVDPPEYFTEGIFVAVAGPTTTLEYKEQVYKRFPEWSPQRHMFMDAPQRQAVRDILGLATAVDGVMVMPKFYCHCDRYWGFLSRCRMPMVPNMKLPFNCPMDSLYETPRWNKAKVKFREHTFLSNPNVPEALKANRVLVSVAEKGVAPKVTMNNRSHVELPYGTLYSDVKAAVLKANPSVRVIEIANDDLRRLCRWLGSAKKNADFNKLGRYIFTESSRYCPQEDMGGYGAPGFDWRNPFTAYNCTWGFHYPAPFPEDDGACSPQAIAKSNDGTVGVSGVKLKERSNSTTCPRQMLCDYNTLPDGRETRPITFATSKGTTAWSRGGCRRQSICSRGCLMGGARTRRAIGQV